MVWCSRNLKTMKYIGNISFVLFVAFASVAFAPSAFASNGEAKGHMKVCPPGKDDVAGCHASVVIDAFGKPAVSPAPSGYGPAAFHAAYTTNTTASGNKIIAIIDAYDQPNIQSDLNAYSAAFGIPSLPACKGPITNSSTPCFAKVNQQGATNKMPRADAGWGLETSLDVEVAHAMCQNCGILLVEANSASYADLMAAVDRAVSMGATVVSNSYGSSEFAGETGYDFHFNHPGVAFTVSSGDNGYGPQYPAASPFVTAVGGTSLTITNGAYAGETAWNGSGSGCSAYESKPSFQTDSGCGTKRTIADVSAVADPATGAAVYDSLRYQGQSGWFQVGGTSLAAPLIAGVYALAGVPAATQANSLPYSFASSLHDIVSGTNGVCTPGYLCSAVAGYDGPTGLGTPNGLGAF
jgi:subtilase family serine protease